MIHSLLVPALAIVISLFATAIASAHSDSRRSCVPPNTLRIPPGHAMASDISKAEFQALLAKIKKTHDSYFRGMGSKLRIKADWDDWSVNAFTDREYDTYIIEVFGGPARYPSLTRDGFSLIVCHEMGRHLGGAPTGMDLGWPSIEGQADYFATLKCLRRVFADEDNEAALRGKAIDPIVRERCESSASDRNERLICQRAALAGLSAAKMFQEIDGRGEIPSFATPDPRVVKRTDTEHPSPQCRLDTYLAGSVCVSDPSQDPGVADPKRNACWEGREPSGYRPRCWYRP